MDSAVLSSYFGSGLPRVKVSGRTFPVHALHLEHALQITQHSTRDWPREASWNRDSRMAQKRIVQEQQLREQLAQGADAPGAAAGDGVQPSSSLPQAQPARSVRDWATLLPRLSADALGALAAADLDAINVTLITQLVLWYVRCGSVDAALAAVGAPSVGSPSARNAPSARSSSPSASASAVLVFLPGTREIQEVQDALLGTPALGSDAAQRSWVLALHGSLPPDEQRRVFERPPEGITKVVLATNVAETSITIDDVGVVIDSGRVKEERYDAARRMASLEDILVSSAAAKQRRGRAGRTQPGLAFHLFTSITPLARHTQPEVRRVGLEQLVMRTKALKLPGRAAYTCSQLPEPPSPSAVEGAVAELTALGALRPSDEVLTPLGRLLSRLPVDAKLGKLLLLGTCLGAADEALTLAAALSSRSPFLSPADPSVRAQADESKRSFADSAQSDHLAALAAYSQFDSLSGEARFSFARERFLGIKT